MKKLISVIALLLCTALLFTACGQTKEIASGGETSVDKGKESTTVKETDKPVELVLGYFTRGEIPRDLGLVAEEINKIIEPKIGARLKEIIMGNQANYLQTINLMLASGEHLDLFSNGNTTTWNDVVGQASKGQLYPMDELLPKYGNNIYEALGKELAEAGRIRGHIYLIPAVKDLAKGNSFIMVKELLEKYDLMDDADNIDSFDDVEKILEVIHKNEPNIWPLFRLGPYLGTTILALGKGDNLGDNLGVLMDYKDKNMKVVNFYETEEFEQAVRTARSWFLKGYLREELLASADQQTQLFVSGRLFAGVNSIKPGMEGELGMQYQREVVSRWVDDAIVTTGSLLNFGWSISYSSQNPDKAMQMINELYGNAEVVNLFAWGIENKHYKKIGDNVITYADGVTADNTGYPLIPSWGIGNQFLTYVFEGEDKDKWTKMDEFNKSADNSVATGFVFEPDTVKNEYSACIAVLNEYGVPLINGFLDVDTALPEFQKKLREAGIEKVIAEKQRQLDNWAKTKNNAN